MQTTEVQAQFTIWDSRANKNLPKPVAIEAELIAFILDGDRCVAEVDGDYRNLFAAAPQLLAAAKKVDEVFARNNLSDANFMGDDEHEAWRIVLAAIDKAEGRGL